MNKITSENNNEINQQTITLVALICLTSIAVVVCIFKTNHLLLESIIVAVAGLAGYKIKGELDNKTINQLRKTIEDLRQNRG